MQVTNKNIIFRDNLMHIFDRLSGERIIYVCAPAGYGKTVAVRQWLDGNTRAKAAIALDEYDNDLTHFCERFCEALHGCQPQNATLTEIISHPAFTSAPDEFTIRAISSLSKRKRAILVIDDLHFVKDARVLHLLLIFLKRLPETFQIVLVSRHDLPSGFSELWIKGHLARVTAEQLLFSNEEIMLLYKKRGGSITQKQADNICRFTGGWAIGVNALLLSGSEPSGESLDYLDDFIRKNIWGKWDDDTREFMLRLAMARELSPSLCTALTGVSDSETLLNKLIRGGMFIFQSSDGLYHYHHLFHGFLKNMLKERGDEYLFPLLEKEGQWHLERQDFYSAADCFIRCKSHEGIAKCFKLLEFIKQNHFIVDKMLPVVLATETRAAAEKYPFLFPSMVWAAFADGRVADVTVYLDEYYARLPEIMAECPAIPRSAFFMRIIDFRVSMHNLEKAVAALPYAPEPVNIVGSISMHLPMIHRCARDFSEFAGEDTEANVSRLRGRIGWLFGEQAELLAETMTAGLLYEQGRLEKAYSHALAANAEIKNSFASDSKFCVMAVFICILDALSQPDEAERVLERLASMIEQDKAYFLNRNFNALILRRKLGKGDINAAQNWLAEHGAALYDSLKFHGIYEIFTTCRAHIAAGDYDSAIILLTKVLELAQAYNRTLDKMEAEILLSIAYWKKKRCFQNEAMMHLENAVSLAYGYGYTQMFVNEGMELSGMLHRLRKSIEQRGNKDMTPSSFVKMLYLKTLEHKDSGLTSGQAEQPIKFTSKQKAVMKLLCEGKSYKEITEILGIKLPTLRSHIALIYKKLDVTSETDAIMKIKTSGLLDEM